MIRNLVSVLGRERLALERIRNSTLPTPRGRALGRDGYVIVECSMTGEPIRWFRYHKEKVWVWTTNKDRAELFPTAATADSAMRNCSVWYESSCTIKKLS